ncbi:transthyretin-like family protein [Sphingobacterium faecale]|uniref:Carboxypeptidase regulatory-like domain-containing protein n=1 Tax=Sphingobacterium faecale TaxID=2803775 RepID=A0ABS1R3U9_9SPHI|nr:hypothetical protein [Sphingobacterium faecale]MBL1409385.1 hypothetical protein [Sphingobacterium faecale]
MVIKKVLLLVCLITSSGILISCLSRLSRPAITGYIFDYNNTPLSGCKVSETKTDAQGRFYLKERRVNRFILTEMFTMEAPPVFFTIDIEKDGYQPYHSDFFQRHGGGRQKGAFDNIDTIYIKRIGQQINIKDYIYDDWIFSTDRNLDTLYGINKNYRFNNPVTNNTEFQDKYNWGLVYKYKSTTPPDGSWNPESYDLLTSCKITLQQNGSYQGIKTCKYINPWRHRKEYDRIYREAYKIPSDSSHSSGHFTLKDNLIHFDNSFMGADAIYKIDSIDRDILILSRKKY